MDADAFFIDEEDNVEEKKEVASVNEDEKKNLPLDVYEVVPICG